MKYNEIISILQKQLGFKPTQSNIASILGVGQSAIGNRVSNKSDFTHEELKKIEEHYEISGLTDDSLCKFFSVISYFEKKPSLKTLLENKSVDIMSKNTFLVSHDMLMEEDVTLCFAFKMDDMSMAPTLFKNDKLILKKCKDEQIIDNEIYYFEYKNETFVRRLINNIDEIIINSDNQDTAYKSKIVKKEEIKIIGQIVSSIRTF